MTFERKSNPERKSEQVWKEILAVEEEESRLLSEIGKAISSSDSGMAEKHALGTLPDQYETARKKSNALFEEWSRLNDLK